MSNGKGGRPPGVNCDHNGGKGRCKKSARVCATILVGGAAFDVLRCWRHYVTLEGAARANSMVFIVDVEVL